MANLWPGPGESDDRGSSTPEEPRQDPHEDQAPGRPRRNRARVLRWSAIGLAVLVAAGSLGSYALYMQLEGNLHVVNAFGGLHNRPPAAPPGVENILLLGSQTRDGQFGGHDEFGTDPGTDLSDNLILVHLDATRTHATVVSIPRDTMVYEPACRARYGGGMVPAIDNAIIDGAMNQGGPSCAVATVEHLTDIRIDHFVRFTFNSFRDMTDVLGGVEVCLPQAVDDPYSHLKMRAGRHFITGNQALEFVRTRHGVGDGSDLGRIELQQEFISSMIQKLESQGTLDNPVKLLGIAEVATRSLSVDPGLGTVSKLLKQAYSLRGLRPQNVTFITMPTAPDPANMDRLVPVQPQDDDLWQLVKSGTLWHGGLPLPRPGTVRVTVLNGSGRTGLAAATAGRLRRLGFGIVGVGNAGPTATTSVSYAGSLGGYAAYRLIGDLASVPSLVTDTMLSQPSDAQSDGSMRVTLTLGDNFGGVRAPAGGAGERMPAAGGQPDAVGAPAPLPALIDGMPVQTRNAAANICSGLPDANPQS